MILPDEILLLIASYLDVKDLANCRSVCRELAAFCAHLIFRSGLSLLNTSVDLRDILKYLRCTDFANCPKKLTVYTARWRRCDRSEWKTHYLNMDEVSRARLMSNRNLESAFAKYEIFLELEERRTYESDVRAFGQVLTRLPNVESICISHLRCYSWNPLHHHRYSNLQKEIGISHDFDLDVEDTVQRFLEAFRGEFSQVRKLSILGSLDLAALEWDWSSRSFPSIRYLEVKSLYVYYNEKSVQDFLLAFPNLIQLSLRLDVKLSTYTLLGSLTWKCLRKLYLELIRSTENDVFSIFTNHMGSLTKFYVRDSYLSDGSWQSFFTRIRDLRVQVDIEAEGKLSESTKVTFIEQPQKVRLASFLGDFTKPWPFADTDM